MTDLSEIKIQLVLSELSCQRSLAAIEITELTFPLRQSESCRLCVLYILNTLQAGFLSCMAFSIYEVVRVACQSRSWFVCASRETGA